MWHGLVRGEVLLGKPEGKKSLERRGCRWENNIETDFYRKSVRWFGLNWSGSGWGQVAVCCGQGNELPVFLRCGEYEGFFEKHVPVNLHDVTSRNTVVFSRRVNLFWGATAVRLTLRAGGGFGDGWRCGLLQASLSSQRSETPRRLDALLSDGAPDTYIV